MGTMTMTVNLAAAANQASILISTSPILFSITVSQIQIKIQLERILLLASLSTLLLSFRSSSPCFNSVSSFSLLFIFSPSSPSPLLETSQPQKSQSRYPSLSLLLIHSSSSPHSSSSSPHSSSSFTSHLIYCCHTDGSTTRLTEKCIPAHHLDQELPLLFPDRDGQCWSIFTGLHWNRRWHWEKNRQSDGCDDGNNQFFDALPTTKCNRSCPFSSPHVRSVCD